MVKELLEARVIKPSHTPFASRVVMVKKKDNSWRMYVDYRQLNKNAIKDKFHISIIEELIDELSGVVVFLKLDLSAPSIFQALMNEGIDNRVVDALSRLENQSELFSLTTYTISTNLFKRVMDSWSDDVQLKEIIDGLQFGTFEKKHYTWVNGKLLRKKTGGW
ncbi:hypothetical protein Tco_0987199 [Tanacetum coccineum]